MLIRQKNRRHPRREGVALLEFVAVLPLYILLILGVWEGGRLFHAMQITSNSAREGARLAARGDGSNDIYHNQPLSSPANIRATVLDYITNSDSKIVTTGIIIDIKKVTGGVETDVDPSDKTQVTQLDQLRVRVTVPYDNFRWSINVPRLIGVNSLVGTVDTRCLLDQPFTLDPTVPVW